MKSPRKIFCTSFGGISGTLIEAVVVPPFSPSDGIVPCFSSPIAREVCAAAGTSVLVNVGINAEAMSPVGGRDNA